MVINLTYCMMTIMQLNNYDSKSKYLSVVIFESLFDGIDEKLNTLSITVSSNCQSQRNMFHVIHSEKTFCYHFEVWHNNHADSQEPCNVLYRDVRILLGPIR